MQTNQGGTAKSTSSLLWGRVFLFFRKYDLCMAATEIERGANEHERTVARTERASRAQNQ